MTLHQWDVVRVRLNPEDRDEHPAVVVSPEDLCADERRLRINVLYGTTRRPGESIASHEVLLNGAEGLERPTVFTCAILYVVDRRKISATLGRVGSERRRTLGRKIVATFRFPLG